MPPSLVARIKDTDPIRQQANKFGPGITPSWDIDGNVSQIEFDTQYTRELAEHWLSDHGYATVVITEHEGEPDPVQVNHSLAFDFKSISGKIIDHPDGSLTVKNVKLLAAGTWTDSLSKTPWRVKPDVLERFASNWNDTAHWARHPGGQPRSITDKIGEVLNVRYENEAVMGDVYYDRLTQASRDTIALVKAGKANFVSVETTGKDRWNVGAKVYDAEEITFTGSATVNRGACATCTLRENEDGTDMKRESEEVSESDSLENLRSTVQDALGKKLKLTYSDGTPRTPWIILTFPDSVIYEDGNTQYRIPYTTDDSGQVTFGDPVQVEMVYQDVGTQDQKKTFEEPEMNEKELEEKFEAFKKQLSETYEGKIKELSEKCTASEARNKELSEQNTALSARLEKIEKTGNPRSLAGDAEDGHELELPPHAVIIEEDGTIRGV